MPDGSVKSSIESPRPSRKVRLGDLEVGRTDSIGARVRDILFRGSTYAIYRSDRGVYVHFSDDEATERGQRQAYTRLCGQICELRYLTSQMGRGVLDGVPLLGRLARRRCSLYDHNMAQALMLLMEGEEQRAAQQTAAAEQTEGRAVKVADRALDMAVRRVTIDNTIRYVRTCVLFGIAWIAALLLFWHFGPASPHARPYLLASVMGAVGAVFSVIVRAQAFELKPCDDSRLNKLVGAIRVGMGGIAAPALLLLVATVFAGNVKAWFGHDPAPTDPALDALPWVAALGLIGGFAERLVPNLVRGAADKAEPRAGTPVQAAKA